MKKICIIGLGRFGQRLARSLSESGVMVLAIDADEAAVTSIRDYVYQAVIADCRDPDVLGDLLSSDFDHVILSTAGDLGVSVLCSLHLKKIGVKHIIAKASSKDHGEILRALGINEVIYPEWESADQLAENLINPNLVKYIPLADEYQIVEINCPKHFDSKSLQALDLRKNYNLFVIAIKQPDDGRTDIMPGADTVLNHSDRLVVIGPKRAINQLIDG